ASALDAVDGKEITCPEPVNNVNLYELTSEKREDLDVGVLPGSLAEALHEFKSDPLMKEAMGESLYSTFIQSREAEIEEFRINVTDWEVKRYLETI
ncbi:MAG: hypothetical protein PHT43_02105, partial [Anaerolineaceae bacterium]|nr:hypothetical protein [Anaerolineaceae bacterium]